MALRAERSWCVVGWVQFCVNFNGTIDKFDRIDGERKMKCREMPLRVDIAESGKER